MRLRRYIIEPMAVAQVSAMKSMITELRAGVGRVNDEILAAAGISGDAAALAEGGEVAAEAAERFNEVMVAFQEGSTAKLKQLEVRIPSLADCVIQPPYRGAVQIVL